MNNIKSFLIILSFVMSSVALWFSMSSKHMTPKVLAILETNAADLAKTVYKGAQQLSQEREKKAVEQKKEFLKKNNDKLFNDTLSPSSGNIKGDIVIAEFFDYRCGYCRKIHNVLKKLLEEDGNIKLVYKEYPIFDEDSSLARGALAAHKQGKYTEFHSALMSMKQAPTADDLDSIASSIGLNIEQWKKDMDDPAIASSIKANEALAESLDVHGTPTFVINDMVVPGALELDEFKALIQKIRQKKS